MRFQDRVAIVTGAGSGIGAATAERLAGDGAKVAIFDIDAASADAVRDRILRHGGAAESFAVDVSNESDVQRAFDQVEALWGVATVVVNCAGVLHVASALETTADDFDRVIRINLRSVFVMSVAAATRLTRAGLPGSIVNVSSIHAVLSEPNASAYTASKGGIEAMSRTFASEWAAHNIRVNCVRPGATRTALTDQLYTPEVLAALAERIPMRDPATVEQIAAGITFLASEDASYCTGTTLDVDGGYIMNGSLPGTEYR